MRTHFKILINVIFFILETKTFAQTSLPSINYVPQEPRAAAYTRYGEIPVDFSTGVPNIEIPLYEIKSGNLSIPISISYHASGIKVNDVASEVGLGWVLNAGGIITQNVLGLPDGWGVQTNYGGGNYLYTHPYPSPVGNNPLTWWRIAIGGSERPDFYTDRYYYKLPGGESGVFRPEIMQENSFVLAPYRPIKIEKTNFDDNPGFRITDADGTQYYFVKVNSTYESQIYLPTKIISSNQTDIINFYYKYCGLKGYRNFYNVYEWWEDKPIDEGCGLSKFAFEKGYGPSNNLFTNSTYSIYVPDSISTNHEKIEFSYILDREDDDAYISGPRLERIYVYNKKRETVKSVKLYNNSYFQSTKWPGRVDLTKRLKLDSIMLSGSDPLKSLNYSFKYNEEVPLPPYVGYTEGTYYFYEDYWGYYNGQEKVRLMPSFLKDHIGSPNDFTYGDLHPDENYAKAGILTEINYPTGGKTVFDYEGNRAETNPYPYVDPDHGNILGMGGLRVKKITSFSGNDTIIKSYEYKQPANKTFLVGNYQYDQPVYLFYKGTGENCLITESATYTKQITTSTPYKPISMYNGPSVLYGKVTEYMGTTASNIGKTEYFYTIYDQNDDIAVPEDANSYPWFFSAYQWEHGNYTPTLDKKITFKNNNGVYDTVRVEVNIYGEYKQNSFLTGLNFNSNTLVENWNSSIDAALANYESFTGYNYFYSLVYSDNIAYTNTKMLTSTTITDFWSNENKTSTTKSIGYDENYLLPKSSIESRSQGTNLITVSKYPFDFATIEPYKAMLNRNELSPVIETSHFIGNETPPIESMKNNYSFWKNDQYTNYLAGSLIIEKGVSNTASITFSLENTLSVKLSMNLEMCTGYFNVNISGPSSFNKNYTICDYANGSGVCPNSCWESLEETITGLKSGSYTMTFAYFPTPGYVNAEFYGTVDLSAVYEKSDCYISTIPTNKIYISSVDTKTESNPPETRLNYHSYDIYGNVISVSRTNDIKETYIWGYNSQYPVIKAMNVDFNALNNVVNSIQSDLQNFLVNTVGDLTTPAQRTAWKSFNNSLRNHTSLSKAQVYTYTYKPLVGMTSQTDPNGVSTYYEYDGFGQLKCIKDDDGNILKTFDYHYKE